MDCQMDGWIDPCMVILYSIPIHPWQSCRENIVHGPRDDGWTQFHHHPYYSALRGAAHPKLQSQSDHSSSVQSTRGRLTHFCGKRRKQRRMIDCRFLCRQVLLISRYCDKASRTKDADRDERGRASLKTPHFKGISRT